jgi:outer membrane immunogenic protein
MKKTVLSIVTAVALSGFGMAGGDIAPVTPAPVDNWSGFYGGVQAGYVWNDADVDYTRYRNGALQSPQYAHGLNVDGAALGLYAGYNWLLSNDILLGIEGEMNMVGASETIETEQEGGNPQNPHGITTVEQNWDAALLLRVGKVMGDGDWLPYVIGGVAWGNFDVTKQTNNGKSFNTDLTLTGWTIGTGLEIVFTENLHARIQYRYTDYGDDTKQIRHTAGKVTRDVDAKLDVAHSHQVMVGLTFRF